MFTINNRRNLRNAAVTTFAAAAFVYSSAGFAAPKRDMGRGHNRQDVYEVRLTRPTTTPTGIGDHDITASAMRNRDLNLSPEPAGFSGSIVTITTPAPFPTGHGNDIAAAPMRNRDLNLSPEPAGFSGSIVTITTPAPFPTGHGNDIAAAPMRNRDLNLSPEPAGFSGSIVTITTPAPFPTGSGHDATAGALRKRDRKVTPENDVFIVTISSPSPFRTTNGHDVTAGALISRGGDSARTEGSASSRSFIQSLDLTSSVRYVGSHTVKASARNPFADGRAWVSVDRDDQDGLVATAGWSFLLK